METIIYNDIELKLNQLPYIYTDELYRACALDKDENEYIITWSITNPECQDESEACDWDNYRVRKV
jgi:hypothetical protein